MTARKPKPSDIKQDADGLEIGATDQGELGEQSPAQTPVEKADAKALPEDPGSTDGRDEDANARPHQEGENASTDHREIEEPDAVRADAGSAAAEVPTEKPAHDVDEKDTGEPVSDESKAAVLEKKNEGLRGYLNRESVESVSPDDEDRRGEIEKQPDDIGLQERSYLTVTDERNYGDIAEKIGLRAVPDGLAIARQNGNYGASLTVEPGDVVALPTGYTYAEIDNVETKKVGS